MDESTLTDAPTPALEPGAPPESSEAPPPPERPGLRRSTSNKVIGGVCGGMGERYDVDANICRVGFVVLSLIWGLGVAIYLAMWVLIPRSDAVPPERTKEPTTRMARHWLTYALVAAVIVLAIIGIATLGAFPRVASGAVILWLIFLVVLAVVSFLRPSRRLTARRIIALFFLVVLSVMILVTGAFAAFLGSTGVPIEGAIGARTWKPTTIAQVESEYRVKFGTANVDLTALPATAAPIGITASVAVGQLTVDVPINAVVDLKSQVGLGQATTETSFLLGTPPSAASAVPHFTVDAAVGVGQLILVRVAYVRP
jgi:phage shock protein PspC (stress-responsive transcriptional regulator)